MIRRLALVMVLAALLTGCFASDEVRDGGNRLAADYGDPAGLAGVTVQSGRDGQSAEFVQTVVQLTEDATADQITSMIVSHPDKVEDAGLGTARTVRKLTFEYSNDADRPTLRLDWKGEPDEAAIGTAVSHWLRVIGLVGPRVQLVLGSDGSELCGVHGPDDQGAISTIFDTLADDEVIAGSAAVWDVTAPWGDAILRYTLDTFPTEEQRASWDALVAALGRLPLDFRPHTLDVRVAARATVDLTLDAPEGMTEETLTPQAYGATLWPAFQAQLDAVPAQNDAWSYFVNWAPADAPTSTSGLITLLSDQEPVDNGDVPSFWSRTAYVYVQDKA